MLTDGDILKLTTSCFDLSAILLAELKPDIKDLSNNKLNPFITESFGFILGYLIAQDGIDLDEGGNCIACLIGTMFGKDTSKFYDTAKALDFYLKLLHKKEKSDYFLLSILNFNLTHPKTWNNFKETTPFEKLDLFSTKTGSLIIKTFLEKILPEKINPVLGEL